MLEIVSLIVGVVSIVLGGISIIIAVKESIHSTENYHKTKELLKTIEHKSELIDRAIQVQQTQLVQIINKALDKIGQAGIDIEEISEEDINKLFEKDFTIDCGTYGDYQEK